MKPDRLLFALLLVAAPREMRAQTDDWKVWGSLSFLQGTIRSPEYDRPGYGAAGGTAALWGTYRHFALSVRSMAMPTTTDMTTGTGDEAILAGVHSPVGRRGDFVAAIGTGRSFGAGYLVPANSERIFAAAPQLDLNYHFVAIGLDAMAGYGSSRRYAAMGSSFS